MGSNGGWSANCSANTINFLWKKTISSVSSWTYQTCNIQDVLSDGRVIVANGGEPYQADSFGKIVVYDSAGVLKWSYDTGGAPDVRVSPDGSVIYAAVSKGVYQSGSGTLYSSYLYAFAADGTYKWKKTISSEGSWTYQTCKIQDVLSDGRVIVANGGEPYQADSFGKIRLYDSAGALKWSYVTGGIPDVRLSPDGSVVYIPDVKVSPDGSVIYAAVSKGVYQSGSRNWYSSYLYAFDDIIPPSVNINGVSTGIYHSADYIVNISGTDIVAYKYKLDNGVWSNEIPSSTSISLSGLGKGSHTLYLIGKNSGGKWQSIPNASTVTWEIVFIGDINNDGNVDIADAILAMQVLSGISPQGTQINNQSNINGDGKIGIAEVIYILQTIAAIRTSDSGPTAPAGMVLIPAGSFQMGDDIDGNSVAMPVHTVTASAFYLDKYEVTKALWDEVYAWATAHGYSFDNVGSGTTANHPVQNVSWYDVVKWLNARSEKEVRLPVYYTNAGQATVYRTGQVDVAAGAVKWSADGYRLPTEAEWEYAARAGTTTRFYTVDCISADTQANYDGSASYYGCPTGQNRGGTTAVGSFPANPRGLYDMAGNVWEWIWDWYGAYSSNAPTNHGGPDSGSSRVLRGGSWFNNAIDLRSAHRGMNTPSFKISIIGFRSAQSFTGPAAR